MGEGCEEHGAVDADVIHGALEGDERAVGPHPLGEEVDVVGEDSHGRRTVAGARWDGTVEAVA